MCQPTTRHSRRIQVKSDIKYLHHSQLGGGGGAGGSVGWHWKLSSEQRAPEEEEKRRLYEERIRDAVMGSLTPLVFSAYGGMGKSSQIFYKRLSSIISDKRGESYSTVIAWI